MKTVEKRYLIPFILVTSLFFLWGIANNMTHTLLSAFKRITDMSDTQTSLIQFAFYGAYFCVALPASLFIHRYSYKSGVILGLALYATGAILFLPAAKAASYTFYLIAIYILASGCSILETTANPYILSMGSPKTATRRLNIAQSFNPIGSITGILLSKFFILRDISYNSVSGTYMTLGCVLIVIMVTMLFVDMPKGRDTTGGTSLGATFRRLLSNRKYKFGVIAQFFGQGAQIGVWSFTIRLAMQELGILESQGATIYLFAVICFCSSRFIYTFLMKFVRPSVLLATGVSLSLLCTLSIVFAAGTGNLVVALLLLTSLFMSLMFPTIYGLALGDVEVLAKGGRAGDATIGASGLIMAIFGGAVFTPFQGIISDMFGIYTSFLVPTLCFVVVIAYALFTIHEENKAITKATMLDMAQYRKSSVGTRSTIYCHTSDGYILVKLYNPGYPEEAVRSELLLADKIWELGIPCPEPGDLVTDGTRLGIRFNRVLDKRSFSRMFADEPERTEEFSREFAGMCRRLHSIECPSGMFDNANEYFASLIDKVNGIDEQTAARMRSFIAKIPVCNKALHGDLHFGNLLSTLEKGFPLTDEHQLKFIDFDQFNCGCPLLDIGMMKYVCQEMDDEERFEEFHIHKEQSEKIWQYFIDEYFFGEGRLAEKWFGENCTANTIEKELEPYIEIKRLQICYSRNLPFRK